MPNPLVSDDNLGLLCYTIASSYGMYTSSRLIKRIKMAGLTRRYFLKLAGSAVCVAAALPFANFSRVYAGECTPDEDMFPACERTRLENPLVAPPASLGRVATWGIQVYEQAKRQSKLVRVARQDDVLPLLGQVIGEAVTPYNATWYKTDDGYVHSMWVQPVENRLNAPEPEQAAEKFWVSSPCRSATRAERQTPNRGDICACIIQASIASSGP